LKREPGLSRPSAGARDGSGNLINDTRQIHDVGRPLRGDEFTTSYDSYGSAPASRFGNLTAGLLSFELDCQAADFRENPGSASCSLRIDQEIGMSMTGIKVQRS